MNGSTLYWQNVQAKNSSIKQEQKKKTIFRRGWWRLDTRL